MEFLIRTNNGECFDLHVNDFEKVFHPKSFTSRRIEGNGEYCLEVEGCQVTINYEMPGLQVVIDGDISREKASQIVEEIRQNVTAFTGQSGEILDFNVELKGKVIRFE
jgi:archaellum component FlaG (FlaF/FlaG flagellin family)